ncbi:MAG TPA: hypothetical protein PLX84_13795, partial [Acidiphilium sp.]|nr:hypothetical protein [Acidiphilium sp.]
DPQTPRRYQAAVLTGWILSIKRSIILIISSAALLSGCAAQPESVISCLNNPTGCLVNADTKVVKQFRVPVGTATISENPITGTGLISEYNGSGQYESDPLGKITNLRVSRPYHLQGQTDVAISGSTAGCSDQVILFANSYNRGSSYPLLIQKLTA